MKIGPITDAMAAERIRVSRANFNDAAAYVRDHPPPAEVDREIWAAHGLACAVMVQEMDEALEAWEGRQ